MNTHELVEAMRLVATGLSKVAGALTAQPELNDEIDFTGILPMSADEFAAEWHMRASSIERDKPLSILDIALAKGAKEENGSINGGEFDRLGLPLFCGCQRCGASLGAYNAFPSKTGFTQCKECIGWDGFSTVEAFDEFMDKLEAENAADDDDGDA